MSRTYRIWQRKPSPERLPFDYTIKFYASDKCRLTCINKIWKIRNRWWKTLRHYNKMLCKKSGMRLNAKFNIDSIDEYFNIRYKKADYTEYFD